MYKINMRKIIFSLLISSTSLVLAADNDLESYSEETEEIWQSGVGSQDGAFSAISVSMLGWGLGMAAVIAVVASVLHQSSASSSHSHSHACP